MASPGVAPCLVRRAFGTRPEDDEKFSDMLYRVRTERAADFTDHVLAFVPVTGEHAHLDQLVAVEAALDFPQHCGRDPGLADADEWSQVVGAGAERATLGRG
jgi:hypothetical protein